jgi:predicted PurR-regulated permease PerM
VQRSWWWWATSGATALALGIGIVAGVWLLAREIGILILGITIAALLTPLVQWMAKWLPRTLAVVIVYLLLIMFLGGMGWIIIPPIVSQVQKFIDLVPSISDQIQQWIQGLPLTSSTQVSNLLTSQFDNLVGSLTMLPSVIFGTLFDFLLIVFISLYTLILAPTGHTFLMSLFPEDRQKEADDLLKHVIREMGGYLRGAAINGLIIGSLTALGLFLLGVDFPLALGALAGLLELVPFIGPIVAAVPMALVALLKSPTTALLSLAFSIALHQFESEILVPNIMRSQTDISPLIVLIAFSAGYTIGGPFGALVVIPLVAALRAVIIDILVPIIQRKTGAEQAELSKQAKPEAE